MADPAILRFARDHWRYLLSRVSRDRSALLIFMFHALVADERDLRSRLVDPEQCCTVGQLRRLVEFHLELGHRFVAPDEVLSGLEAGDSYVLVTFDDGYFNNHLVLTVLEEFGVPAAFFVATGFVRDGRSFWPNVVYRKRWAAGNSEREIARETALLKSLPPRCIEKHLVCQFGAEALGAVDDVERPFRPTELSEFARHSCVHIGNHTRDHAILTNLSPEEARRQIAAGQEDLHRMCGTIPRYIAYPNGNHSQAVLRAAAEEGLTLGVTVEKHKNYLPFLEEGGELLTLGRFHFRNDRPLLRQMEIFRSDVHWRRRAAA